MKIEGKTEEKRAIAKNLLKENLGLHLIAQATGLSIEEIERLKDDKSR